MGRSFKDQYDDEKPIRPKHIPRDENRTKKVNHRNYQDLVDENDGDFDDEMNLGSPDDSYGYKNQHRR